MTAAKSVSAASIGQRWRDLAGTRGEVFLVAHRGAFIRDNLVIDAENSISAIERARNLGCDMVEIDVHFTADGTAVVLHDTTLDRTTDGRGAVADHSYKDIKTLSLVHPATRLPFDSSIPTLEDAFLAIGQDMMINVECKSGIDAIPKVAEIAGNAGVLDQVTVKTNARGAVQLENVADVLARSPKPIDYIPILIDQVDGIETLQKVCDMFDLSCVECVVQCPQGTPGFVALDRLGYTEDGGVLFSIEARRIAEEHGVRQFINTLYVDPAIPGAQWNGGRNCQLARIVPDSVYSFWIAHGATVIQTDEPEFALGWLQSAGFRAGKGP